MKQPIGSEALKQRSTDGGGLSNMPKQMPAEKMPKMAKQATLASVDGGRLKMWG